MTPNFSTRRQVHNVQKYFEAFLANLRESLTQQNHKLQHEIPNISNCIDHSFHQELRESNDTGLLKTFRRGLGLRRRPVWTHRRRRRGGGERGRGAAAASAAVNAGDDDVCGGRRGGEGRVGAAEAGAAPSSAAAGVGEDIRRSLPAAASLNGHRAVGCGERARAAGSAPSPDLFFDWKRKSEREPIPHHSLLTVPFAAS